MSEQRAVIVANEVKARQGTSYPVPEGKFCMTREKRALGDQFGLTQFGVNLTTLPPGCWSSLRHWHRCEDEFVYVVEGELTLIDNDGEHVLSSGMCAGFKAGIENGHHLVNRTQKAASYIEIGSRIAGEEAIYSDIDMKVERKEGGVVYSRRNGTPL